jgi:hypothetical protein
MAEEQEPFKINSITRDFVRKVNLLIDRGTKPSEIIDKLNWNKTSYSLVNSEKRDVPVDVWENLHYVFKFENDLIESKNSLNNIVGNLTERIINLEGQAEVYKNILAAILTGKEIELSNDPIAMSIKIEHLNSLIDDTISRKLKK